MKRCANTHKLCDGDIKKVSLMLKNDVCPSEYMDGWESFNETSLPDKKEFYSNLTKED